MENQKIVDPKPKNEVVFDPKPKNEIAERFTDRLYEVPITSGMPIGLLLTLTYSEAGTVLSPVSR